METVQGKSWRRSKSTESSSNIVVEVFLTLQGKSGQLLKKVHTLLEEPVKPGPRKVQTNI